MNDSKLVNSFTGRATYQITVNGTINPSFLPLLGDVSLAQTETKKRSITTLTGEVIDQSALAGLINTLIDYRYTVISVLKLEQ